MTLMRRALGLLEASEDALGVARAHLTCAEILLLEGEADLVTPHLERADKLFELGADTDDLGALRTAQALRAVLVGNAEAAQALAREALDYLTENAIDPRQRLAGARRRAGSHRDVDAATDSFHKAVELLGQSGEWREAVAAYREWAHALRSVAARSSSSSTWAAATSRRRGVRLAAQPKRDEFRSNLRWGPGRDGGLSQVGTAPPGRRAPRVVTPRRSELSPDPVRSPRTDRCQMVGPRSASG